MNPTPLDIDMYAYANASNDAQKSDAVIITTVPSLSALALKGSSTASVTSGPFPSTRARPMRPWPASNAGT